MTKLYKYLSSQYALRFATHGEVLFRTLSYFRAVEHAARGDEVEGMHMDAPDNDVTLETDRGLKLKGRYRFLRAVNQELTYAFCCSTELSDQLYESFNADACVVILDPDRFFLKCKVAAKVPLPLDPPGLMHGPVSYFAPNREAPLDITVPRNLPFLKHQNFADQKEYRAVYARKGGLKVTMRLVQPQFTFSEEVAAARKAQRLLRLGSLRDIVEVIHR